MESLWLGGSASHVCFHLAALHSGLTCVVQDLPGLEEKFKAVRPDELADSVSFMTHDFFTKQLVEGADVYSSAKSSMIGAMPTHSRSYNKLLK
jgi:hypothetical protein